MAATNYVEVAMLEWALKNKAPAAPLTELWLALTEAKIEKGMTGKEIGAAEAGKELSYEGYKRTKVKCEAATWKETAGSGESTATKYTNEAAISLPLSTKNEGNKIAKYFALCEKEKASETGKVFFFGKLTSELEITTSITKLEIEAGKLEISCE